jgi:hypothetical protein
MVFSSENVMQTILSAGKIAYVTFSCGVVRQRRMRDFLENKVAVTRSVTATFSHRLLL